MEIGADLGYFTLFVSRGGGASRFFTNAVLKLYLKLFTFLEIITMLK